MEKKRLVDFVAKIMEKSGFRVYKNFKTSKYLIDIYGVLSTTLGDFGIVVACKNYEERWKVGLDVLKEMEMITKTLQASKVVVVTTSTFSDNAIDYANRRNIKLIDKDGLINLAKSFSSKNIESYEPSDDENESNEETYVLPSESFGSSFFSHGRRGSLTGRRRSNILNKLQIWTRVLLSSTVSLIIIVLAISSLITYIIGLNSSNIALLGILKIFLSAILSYGIVMAVERNLTVTLVKGSTVFFVSLIIFIALIVFL